MAEKSTNKATNTKSKPTKTAASQTANTRAALKKEYKKYKHQIGRLINGLIVVTTLAVLGLMGWIFSTQLTLTPSERVAESFRDSARLDSYQVDFEITGSSGEQSTTLVGQTKIDNKLSYTTHLAQISDEINFQFDVFRNSSDNIEEQQTLTRYGSSDIFVTQLGLSDKEAETANFESVVGVWVSSNGQVPFIDIADTIDSVNLADASWEQGIVKAKPTDKARLYAGRETTGYMVTVNIEQLRQNLEQLDSEGRSELLSAYGVPEEIEITDEQFKQFVEQVVSSYERINESKLQTWLDGSRLIAITSENVIVQNSRFDSIKLVYSVKGAAVDVEPVDDDQIISQQEFIERLGKLQPSSDETQ